MSKAGHHNGTNRSPQAPDDQGTPAGRLTLDGCELVIVRDDESCQPPARSNTRVGSLRLDQHRYAVYRCHANGEGETNLLDRLTPRELEICCLIATGEVNKTIARRLGISPFTVGAHVNRIFCKTGVRSRAALSAQIVHVLGRVPKSAGRLDTPLTGETASAASET